MNKAQILAGSDGHPKVVQAWEQFKQSLHLHRWLIGFAAAYFACCVPIFEYAWNTVYLGMEPGSWLAIVSSAVFIFFMVNVFVWQASWLVPRRYGAGVLRKRIAAKASVERLLLAAPVLFLFGPFSTVFGKIKILIPELNPFAFDAWLAKADTAIHGGTDLWQWLAPVLLNGPAISALTLVYEVAWPAAVLYILVHASLDAKPQRRMQCLYAYFGCWVILGNVLALTFSSAGPVFYERIVGDPGPFGPLMAKLAELDAAGWVTALDVSREIWQAHVGTTIDSVAFSISAMPSLHVAMACLAFLYARRLGRVPGILAGLFLAFIMAGSVMLGWHYALDGYVAIIGVCLIWWAAGRLVELTAATKSVDGLL